MVPVQSHVILGSEKIVCVSESTAARPRADIPRRRPAVWQRRDEAFASNATDSKPRLHR